MAGGVKKGLKKTPNMVCALYLVFSGRLLDLNGKYRGVFVTVSLTIKLTLLGFRPLNTQFLHTAAERIDVHS